MNGNDYDELKSREAKLARIKKETKDFNQEFQLFKKSTHKTLLSLFFILIAIFVLIGIIVFVITQI